MVRDARPCRAPHHEGQEILILRSGLLAASRSPHPEERALARVSKDGGESRRCPSCETLAEFIIGPRFARTRWQAPQDEVVPGPHGEERGNAVRLEPSGQGTRGPSFE